MLSRSRSATLELGWLLLDGGRQEAATRAARLAVTEAMAQRDTAFQSVLLDTAQDTVGLSLMDAELPERIHRKRRNAPKAF